MNIARSPHPPRSIEEALRDLEENVMPAAREVGARRARRRAQRARWAALLYEVHMVIRPWRGRMLRVFGALLLYLGAAAWVASQTGWPASIGSGMVGAFVGYVILAYRRGSW